MDRLIKLVWLLAGLVLVGYGATMDPANTEVMVIGGLVAAAGAAAVLVASRRGQP